jgi:NADPH:quinone reductase-like Zn-dependent oxidoreductase
MGRIGGLDRIVKALVSAPFVSQSMRTWVADENKKDLVVLKELLESGKVTPVIDRSYGLSEAPQAIRYVEEGHTQGKVMISLSSPA